MNCSASLRRSLPLRHLVLLAALLSVFYSFRGFVAKEPARATIGHQHLGVILGALPSLPVLAQGEDELGAGGYVKWGLEQQIFAAVFFVIFPFGVLYLLFSGRFGWWNYDFDGKELSAEEYKKANKVDKPTWGRFPWELDSDLYNKK